MQRYFAKETINNKVILEDSDYHHIKNVMRYENNQEIEVVYDKKLYIATIIDINNYNITITREIKEKNELNIDLTIAIGLVKEQKFDLILQKLTELGVNKIIPLNMNRSIIKLDENKIDKKIARWQTICKEASEQSKRINIPTITRPMSLSELVKIDSTIKLVASTSEKENFIGKYLQQINNYDKIIVVIGPEGGITDKEQQFLNGNAYNSVSLGRSILRVETAALYVASVINYNDNM